MKKCDAIPDHDVEVLSVTRGHVRIRIGDRVATITGELLLPMAGEPDFIVFSKMFSSWDPPHAEELLDRDARDDVIEKTRIAMAKLSYVVEVE